MKFTQPVIKIALIIAVILLGFYSFFAYMDIQDYLDVNNTCAKAVNGFPADKLAPLGRSGGLQIDSQQGTISFSNDACTCNIAIKDNKVIDNQGTYCAKK